MRWREDMRFVSWPDYMTTKAQRHEFECASSWCAGVYDMKKEAEPAGSAQIKKAIEDTRYTDSYKIACESKRFWETEYNIYGGISRLSDGPINMVWYPSSSMHGDLGVLISGYGMQSIPAFNDLPTVDAKLAASRAAVERLHPGYGNDLHSPM